MNFVYEDNEVIQNGKTLKQTVFGSKTFLWHDLLIVFVLALSLRFPFLLRSFGDTVNRQMVDDSYGYESLANSLVDGKGFCHIQQEGSRGEKLWIPELCRTPSYPLLIAGFEWVTGHGRVATIIFQQVLGIALCLMVMVICQRYFGRKAGLIAGFLLVLDFQAIALSNMLLADFVFCFLLFSSIILSIKTFEKSSLWFGVAAGLLLSVSVLTKPVGIALPLIISGIMIFYACVKRRKNTIPAAVVMFVVAYLPICGWVIRNGVSCGEYIFSSTGRSALLSYVAGMTLARSEGVSREVAAERLANIAEIAPSTRIRHGKLSPEEKSNLKGVAISTLIRNKSAFIQEYAISSVNLFFGPEKNSLLVLGLPHIALGIQEKEVSYSRGISIAAVAVLAFETLVLGSVYLMICVTLWKCIKLHRLPYIILLCLISSLYLLALSSLPPGCPRYRSAATPLLVVLAVASFSLNRQNDKIQT